MSSSPSSFRVFNKGARQFDCVGGIKLAPGAFTPIPTEHVEAIRKVMADYPNELFDGGSLGAQNAAATVEASALQKKLETVDGEAALLREENKTLLAENERLTNAANARLGELNAARDMLATQATTIETRDARIAELTKAVAAKKK